MKILIIGGGNMGLTYAQSILKSHILEKKDLMILEKSPEKIEELQKMDIGVIHSKPESCITKADLIILAVKPQDTTTLFPILKPHIDKQQVFLSIMAGVKINAIRKSLGAEKIIRSMPNLPAQIGMGMTVFTSSTEVTRIELVTVQNLLNTTGKTIYLENEDLIDAATAISGSGPAYVYFFMNAMMEAAMKLGFSPSQAELLVGQTFLGSVHLQKQNDLTCQEWISKVASRGGTTEAAMNSFNENRFHQIIKDGLESAHNRAVELGNR